MHSMTNSENDAIYLTLLLESEKNKLQQTESGYSDFLLVLYRSLYINVTSDAKISMFLST